MPIERFACLAAGAGIMLGLLFVHSHPIPADWDKAAHFLTFALITALLWRGTDGRAPLAVPAAVVAFGALDELHQIVVPGRSPDVLDFAADALAAAAVAGLALLRGKTPCVESSPP